MKTKFLLLWLLLGSFLYANDDVTGFWQTMDKKTNKPSSVIAVYSYQGKYYGRIIGIFNDQGTIEDSIYTPITRAPGVVGDPYYCGLDIVYGARPSDENRFKGYVIDPRKGKVYDAKIWRKGNNLILRGEVFVFGKNITWPPFPEQNFTATFKKPDLSTFVPNVPQVK